MEADDNKLFTNMPFKAATVWKKPPKKIVPNNTINAVE